MAEGNPKPFAMLKVLEENNGKIRMETNLFNVCQRLCNNDNVIYPNPFAAKPGSSRPGRI
jgi:hypothetical protein